MTETVLPLYYVDVEEECKRNPKLRMSDLQILKDWMDKQPHLPKIPIFYLILFLHSNYYHIEPSKIMINNYVTIKMQIPEVFSNRNPVDCKELRKAFDVVAILPLVQRTKENYEMTFGKFLDSSVNNFNFTECLKYMFMTAEVQHVEKGTSDGFVFIVDATGFTFGHISRVNFMIIKTIIFFIQEVVPVRLKAFHVLNVISTVETLFNMVKPFIKMELLGLIHFHKSVESLKEYIPVEALPNEVGGQAGPIKNMVEDHIKHLEKYRAWFEYEEKIMQVNESLRVDKFQAENIMFGVDGSFKKLEID